MENQSKVSQEHSCGICLQVFYKPVNLPCKHIFCKSCLQDSTLIGQNYRCPLCRAPFVPIDIKQNEDLNVKMMQLYPQAYAEKKKAIKERIHMQFLIGNSTQHLNTNQQNKYRWTFYMRPVQGGRPLSETIESVHVKLHPTFNPAVLKYTVQGNQCISFCRNGWGTFRIEVIIFWKNCFKETQSEIHHDLQFQPVNQRVVHTALTMK